MIPICLTVEGLYSYQERQKIDFSKLTSAGLFGIFGITGSGKSAILEAITYVLYGQIDRMGKGHRSYNMMNLRSNRLYIEFDFMNHENKIFRAVRDLNRSSDPKKFKEVKAKTKAVLFYQMDENGENPTPLEYETATPILGLNYENFIRTIIIPQGQFRAFLDLGATDRSNMLKEIFGLQRFDLAAKTKQLKNEALTSLNKYEGQLKAYSHVSSDIKEEKEKLFQEQTKKFQALQEIFTKKEQELLQAQKIKSDYQNLTEKKQEYSELLLQQEEINELEKQTEIYDKLVRLLKNPIEQLEKSIENENKFQNIQLQAERELKTVNENLEKVKNEKNKILPAYESLKKKHSEVEDLKKIAEIKSFQKTNLDLDIRLSKGQSFVEKEEKTLVSHEAEIKKISSEIEQLLANQLNTSDLMEIEKWFIQKEQLEAKVSECHSKIKEWEEKIGKTVQKFEESNIPLNDFERHFSSKEAEIVGRKTDLEQTKNKLAVQQQLLIYSNQLIDGQPCPLCGSEHHPKLLENIDHSQDVKRVEAAIKENENLIKGLHLFQNEVNKWVHELNIFKENKSKETKFQSLIIQELEQHGKTFRWPDFQADNKIHFEQQKKAFTEIENQLKEKRKKKDELQKLKDLSTANLNRYQNGLTEIKNEQVRVLENIKVRKENLKELIYHHYEEISKERLVSMASELQKENERCENNFQLLTEKIHQYEKEQVSKKENLEQLKNRLEDIKQEKETIVKQIDQLLLDLSMNSVEEVKQILAQNLNIEKLRDRIQGYKIKIHTLKNAISELQKNLNGIKLNDEDFQKLTNDFKELKESKESQQVELIKLQNEVEDLQVKLKEKMKLEAEHEKVRQRDEYLYKLQNLFNSAGFVNYVSSIYLSQLCDHANERFLRMTRNQLSLMVNENNEFEIIDYLNEGRNRSVKTLSGGQTFQVSLSLALALAESVQNHARAEKNFFFIDEGFGTQDGESVNVIFETLLDLQKEKKIVGIISHVDELKEKMPMVLKVVKDATRGSLIY